MKKLYVDCCTLATSGGSYVSQLRRFHDSLKDFEERLRGEGFVILNFTTPDLPFDPHLSDIAAFIKHADAVLALGIYPPSIGFSASVKEASNTFRRPRFLFIPHKVDLCYTPTTHPVYAQRCLFHSPDYPARVLKSLVGAPESLAGTP